MIHHRPAYSASQTNLASSRMSHSGPAISLRIDDIPTKFVTDSLCQSYSLTNGMPVQLHIRAFADFRIDVLQTAHCGKSGESSGSWLLRSIEVKWHLTYYPTSSPLPMSSMPASFAMHLLRPQTRANTGLYSKAQLSGILSLLAVPGQRQWAKT